MFAYEPQPASGETLALSLLEEVAVPVRARARARSLLLSELVALEIGAVLPMSKEGRAQLCVGSTSLAFGVCGVTRGRLAVRIDTTHESQEA